MRREISKPRLAGMSALLLLATALSAHAACPPRNDSVPKGANTTDPAKPFYIDLTGLDIKTTPPTRDPHNPNYPKATELPAGQLPSATQNGNFIIGPVHPAAPETLANPNIPHGTVQSFTMTSTDGELYSPAMVRDDPDGCLNASIADAPTAPGDLSNIIVSTAHPGTWTRGVDVYVPAGARPGTEMPFIVVGDGGPHGFFHDRILFNVLDNLIAAHRLPPMVAVTVEAGGQDAQGSERGLEYDTVSGMYGDWIERDVLPRAESIAHIKLTHDPKGRATMGISSSGAAAFTMAWFHPGRYGRVLAYSPTMVNQAWPHNPALPGGAWEYHDNWPGPAHPVMNAQGVKVTPSSTPDGAPLIPNTPVKPIRYWFETGDRDLFYPIAPLADGMHDWTMANEDMAKVLAAKGYTYQFVFARNATHVDPATVAQTLPEALEWLWNGY